MIQTCVGTQNLSKLMLQMKIEAWDTFDGFRMALGDFFRHLLAPAIKVIGNSFLIQGLFLPLFGQLFSKVWPFLNRWDPATANSCLDFENRSTHGRAMGKMAGFFYVKMSNHRFQRVIFNTPIHSPKVCNLSTVSCLKWVEITFEWPEIVKMFRWWPNLTSESSKPCQIWPFFTEIARHIQRCFDDPEAKGKLISDAADSFSSGH